jgi:hypothetical protein
MRRRIFLNLPTTFPMKVRSASLILVVTLEVSGCAMSSGVLKMGPDTYSVNAMAAPARGGVTGAKTIVYREANAECAKQGREILVVNESTGVTFPANGRVDLTFRCLAHGDPALATAIKGQDQ